MKTLTWKVDKTIPTACPDYQPDPYTGEYPMTHCLVYHFTTITESKTAEFTSEKEAKDFAHKAPSSCYEFRLNGKLLKDKRKLSSNVTFVNGGLTVGNTTTTINGTNSISLLEKKY